MNHWEKNSKTLYISCICCTYLDLPSSRKPEAEDLKAQDVSELKQLETYIY